MYLLLIVCVLLTAITSLQHNIDADGHAPWERSVRPDPRAYRRRYLHRLRNPVSTETSTHLQDPYANGEKGLMGTLRGLKGQMGFPGIPGLQVRPGFEGTPGKDGTPGHDGRPGFNGIPCQDGRPGLDAIPSIDGRGGRNWMQEINKPQQQPLMGLPDLEDRSGPRGPVRCSCEIS